jgi:ABC-type transport system substrate-binding protein
LLAEAGVANGFALKAGVGNASPLYLQIGELIAGQLKDVGINMTITQVDQAQAFNLLIRSGTYQAAPYGGQALPDTAQQFRDYFMTGGLNNLGNVEAPGIADLIAKAAPSIDPATRAALFKQANRIAVEQVQHGVVLYFQPSVQVERKYIGGVQPGLLACQFNFRGVYISAGKVDVP